jgi:hypothetical protein
MLTDDDRRALREAQAEVVAADEALTAARSRVTAARGRRRGMMRALYSTFRADPIDLQRETGLSRDSVHVIVAGARPPSHTPQASLRQQELEAGMTKESIEQVRKAACTKRDELGLSTNALVPQLGIGYTAAWRYLNNGERPSVATFRAVRDWLEAQQ